MANQSNQANQHPTYTEIADGLRRLILNGVLEPGQQLHPIREMAAKNGVSLGTMKNALSLLRNEGLVEGHPGKAVYVCSTLAIRKVLTEEEQAAAAEAVRAALTAAGYAIPAPSPEMTDTAAQVFVTEDETVDVEFTDSPWTYTLVSNVWHVPAGEAGDYIQKDFGEVDDPEAVVALVNWWIQKRYREIEAENARTDTPKENA
ncbi:winged helix-turn-helix domain-containing protein [Streptosporangium sp. NPDC050855]|uniref:winged helix-turn-helix domain-containing protein n=1 Tax=Streptosporangium sp. NPDC050855 TaxID=3366194 RepID=UPI00379E50BD